MRYYYVRPQFLRFPEEICRRPAAAASHARPQGKGAAHGGVGRPRPSGLHRTDPHRRPVRGRGRLAGGVGAAVGLGLGDGCGLLLHRRLHPGHFYAVCPVHPARGHGAGGPGVPQERAQRPGPL